MSIDRAKAALRLFEEALAVPGEQQTSWIANACGSDQLLVEEVHSLLEAHRRAENFLESAPQSQSSADAPKSAHTDFASCQQLGDFIIECEIGAGGMGIVYRAQQESLNRPVALKVLPPYLRRSESARNRFRREIEAAARLRHRNIVPVYTTGEEHGTAFYAMELIEGPALSELLAAMRKNPVPELRWCQTSPIVNATTGASTIVAAGDVTPPPEDSAQIFDLSLLGTSGDYFQSVAKLTANVADGLDYAHRHQIVHRDVKPSNLLFSVDGEVHIGDFGLARIVEEPGLTRTNEVLGTPFYMAPEQVNPRFGEVDARSDVYALGATLYELLTLRPPFTGESRDQVMAQIANEEPLPPRRVNRIVPRDLNTICLKAIDRQPTRRYQTARALADDLRRYLAGRPIAARPLNVAARLTNWVGRHRTWAAAILLIGCLATLAGVFAYRTYLSEARWTQTKFNELFETAQLAAMEGQLSRAREAIDMAEQLGAPDAQMQLLRGQLALQSGLYQEACDALELAAEQLPGSVAAQALLARAYRANEQREESQLAVGRLSRLTPVTLQDFLMLGNAQSLEDFVQASATLDEAVERNKTSVVARLVRGNVLIDRAKVTADAQLAEKGIDDIRIASELIEPNPYLLSRIIEGHLVAASAYRSDGRTDPYDDHLTAARRAVAGLEAFPDYAPGHGWRAFYYDYVGGAEQALSAWRDMSDWRIAYLVLALFRQGEFDQARKYCEQRLARYPGARFTMFLEVLIASATAESGDILVAAFEPANKETLDPLHAHRFHYTIFCLAGRLEAARDYCKALRSADVRFSDQNQSEIKLLDYTCGDIAADEILRVAAPTRDTLCRAHFFVGLTNLANGDRTAAQQHFQRAADVKIVGYLEDHIGRAISAQLNRDPSWPKWIADNKLDAAE